MKKIYFALVVMLCMGTFPMHAADWWSSLPVIKVAPDAVPPNDPSNGALRDAFDANGSAIYELTPGGIYFINGTCNFGTSPAVVRTSGAGARAIIIPITLTGAPKTDILRSSVNVRFENLYIYGVEYGTGAAKGGLIRILDGGGTSFEFENCYFDGSSSAALLRFDNVNANTSTPFVATVNNCTFRNAVDYTNVGNSRGIDLRDSKGVSLKVTNCTFYSVSAQTLRQGAVQIDELVFDHNTVFGAPSAFDVGVAENGSVTNNIFYNLGLNGITTGVGSFITFTSPNDFLEKVEIKNNLFYRDPAFDVLNLSNPNPGARYLAGSNILNSAGYNYMNADPSLVEVSDTLSYAIPFKNPPASVLPFYQYLWIAGNFGGSVPVDQQTFIRREIPLAVAPGLVDYKGDNLGTVAPYDFSYPKSSPAAIAGVGGTYLGAWAPFDETGINPINTNDAIQCWFDGHAKTLNMTFGSSVPVVRVSIYSSTGALVSNQLVIPNGQTAQFKPAELSKGVYLFAVEIPDGVMVRGKFVY